MTDEELAEIRTRAVLAMRFVNEEYVPTPECDAAYELVDNDISRLMDEIARLKAGEVRSLMDGVRMGVRATFETVKP